MLIRKIVKDDYKLSHACPSTQLYTWNNSAPNGRIFVKFDI